MPKPRKRFTPLQMTLAPMRHHTLTQGRSPPLSAPLPCSGVERLGTPGWGQKIVDRRVTCRRPFFSRSSNISSSTSQQHRATRVLYRSLEQWMVIRYPLPENHKIANERKR